MCQLKKNCLVFFLLVSSLWAQKANNIEEFYEDEIHEDEFYEENFKTEKVFEEKFYDEKIFVEKIEVSGGLEIQEKNVVTLKQENLEDYFKNKYDIDWGYVASRFAIGTSVIVVTGTITIAAGTTGVLGTVAFAAFKGAVEGAVAGAAVGAALGSLEGYLADGSLSAAEKHAVEAAADGYMWGAIIGAVSGGLRGVKEVKVKKTKIELAKACEAGGGSGCVDETFLKVSKAKNFDSVKGCNVGAKNMCVKNYKYAGRVYTFDEGSALARKYPKGVPFNINGYPDFSQYAKATVTFDTPSLEGLEKGLCLSGNDAKDFLLANKAMGYSYTPPGYTWHHLEDMKTMILVPQDIHSVAAGGVAHDGGASLLRAFYKGLRLGIK